MVRGGLETRGDGLSAGCGAGSETRLAGGARGRGVTRAAVVRGGQGRDEGLELVWRHRGDGYFLQFTWHPNRPSRALQGTFRFQVEPNCAHLDLFRELTA